MVSTRVKVGIFILLIIGGGSAGMVYDGYFDDRYPPGAFGGGIADKEKLISNHNQVVMSQNVIRNSHEYSEGENQTTRIDREDNQVHMVVEGEDDEVYYVNGSEIGGPDYGLQYERTEYSEDDRRDIGYAVKKLSRHDELEDAFGWHDVRSGIADYEWQFEGITPADDGWNYTTYSSQRLADHIDEGHPGTIVSAEMVVRSDGLVVEYYERGTWDGEFYERRISTTVTDDDVVTEPSWTDAAERDEESDDDGVNLWECGPNDIDGDGDGLCNEW